jgi:hypothetical protein
MDQATADKLADLIAWLDAEAIVIPRRWNNFYNRLMKAKPPGLAEDVPLPLILGGWWNSNSDQQAERFRLHLEFAARWGVLDDIDQQLRLQPPSA